jgi:hypothetical protein
MGDSVFIETRAAVHRTSAGKSIAFPDVCLCPPTPPAGPVPVPLPNTVVAMDLQAGAPTVLIEGNPAGKKSSFFMKSTGNEVSLPTGGGVMTHAVQGMARFQTFSTRVFFQGEPAVRHLDLLTHNHLAVPPNTPPAPWLSMMKPPSIEPPKIVRKVGDETDEVAIRYVPFGEGRRRPPLQYVLTLSDGRKFEGSLPEGAGVYITGLPPGSKHTVEFPEKNRAKRTTER